MIRRRGDPQCRTQQPTGTVGQASSGCHDQSDVTMVQMDVAPHDGLTLDKKRARVDSFGPIAESTSSVIDLNGPLSLQTFDGLPNKIIVRPNDRNSHLSSSRALHLSQAFSSTYLKDPTPLARRRV
nr:hypothetical protein Iba_chr04dCG2810 [Ipomoea batatas]